MVTFLNPVLLFVDILMHILYYSKLSEYNTPEVVEKYNDALVAFIILPTALRFIYMIWGSYKKEANTP